jgi:aspartate/methionine/tyrosine aminotransferase
MARRLELLAWARQSGAFIVEDDYTSEFRYSGPPLASLQGLDDTEQVIYVGTLNKALFPGLRIVYAVVSQALLQAFLAPAISSIANLRRCSKRSCPNSCNKAISLRTFVACASYIANSATRWRRR